MRVCVVDPGETSKMVHGQMHATIEQAMISEAMEHGARLRALRSVALFELAKGLLVLAAAVSLYWVDPSNVAGGFLDFLHISPDRHLAQLLLRLADSLSNLSVWGVVLAASIYSGLRFLEAYGLWKARPWAEWIALVSGAVYVPFEIYRLVESLSVFHVGVLLVNLAIVAFMFYLRVYVPRLKPELSRVQ